MAITKEGVSSGDNLVESVKLIDHDLGITLEELRGGKKIFRMEFGGLGRVEVIDIPANVLTSDEIDLIDLARRSYKRMWGGKVSISHIAEDCFDGKPPYDDLYKTTHQIAIFETFDGRRKVVTNRKVEINPSAEDTPPLYDDIVFWEVVDQDNKKAPLSDFLPKNVAAISRTGIFPYSPLIKDEVDHDITAVSWSMMQIATTNMDRNTFFVCMLDREFPERIHNIKNPGDGSVARLDFTNTSTILGIPAESKIQLDRTNPYVQAHLFEFPGYWLDGGGLSKLLKGLAADSKLSVTDFLDSCLDLSESDERPLLSDESASILEELLVNRTLTFQKFEKLIDLFTKPRYCKYLIPLINHNDKGQDLRNEILSHVAERPFSSTLIPSMWEESAKRLLRAAKKKYA